MHLLPISCINISIGHFLIISVSEFVICSLTFGSVETMLMVLLILDQTVVFVCFFDDRTYLAGTVD